MIEGWIVYLLAVPLAGLVARRGRRAGRPAFQVAIGALFVVYLGWIVGATFFPLPVNRDLVRIERAESGVVTHWVPGRAIRERIRLQSRQTAVYELGGNVLVFAPFGFLLPIVAVSMVTWRRMLVAGLLLSLSIEFGQLAVSLILGYSYRVAETDDVILNVAGVLLGFAVWWGLRGRLAGGAPGPGPGARTGEPGPSVLGR